MKWYRHVFLPVVALLLPVAGEAGELEPVVAAVEPFSLRTALSKPLKDAKQTVVTPAQEDNVVGLSHLSEEEFSAAFKDWNEFMDRAAAAATRLLVSIKPEIIKGADGQITCIRLHSPRPFVPSIIFSPRLIPLFQAQLGERLVALIPNRNTLYLFPRNFGDFQNFGRKILQEHEEATYPSSIEAFEITRESVKCLGAFDTGGEPGSPEPGAAPAPDDKPAAELPPRQPNRAPSAPPGQGPGKP